MPTQDDLGEYVHYLVATAHPDLVLGADVAYDLSERTDEPDPRDRRPKPRLQGAALLGYGADEYAAVDRLTADMLADPDFPAWLADRADAARWKRRQITEGLANPRTSKDLARAALLRTVSAATGVPYGELVDLFAAELELEG